MDYETVVLIESKPNARCKLCNGDGHVYWANNDTYDVEPCECQAGNSL